MAESRNLNSGFLHTSFVDFDFTVAKIITILPTGYRAQLVHASYCRKPRRNYLPLNGAPLWRLCRCWSVGIVIVDPLSGCFDDFAAFRPNSGHSTLLSGLRCMQRPVPTSTRSTPHFPTEFPKQHYCFAVQNGRCYHH